MARWHVSLPCTVPRFDGYAPLRATHDLSVSRLIIPLTSCHLAAYKQNKTGVARPLLHRQAVTWPAMHNCRVLKTLRGFCRTQAGPAHPCTAC